MKNLTLGLLPFLMVTAVSASSHRPPIALGDLTHIHGVVVPAGSDNVLLATHHGLFSVDPAGVATMISQSDDDFMGFTASRDGQLFASGHPSSGGNIGVVGSTGPGADWSRLSDGAGGPVDFHAMTVSPADENTVYGSFGGIQVSRDAGRTWEVSGPGPDELIDIAASSGDAGHLYAGTMKGLFESFDFGRNWQLLAAEGNPASAVEISPDGTLFVFVAGQGLQRLEDDNLVTVADVTNRVLLHIGFDPDDAGRVMAVDTESEVIASTDGGKSWSPFAP